MWIKLNLTVVIWLVVSIPFDRGESLFTEGFACLTALPSDPRYLQIGALFYMHFEDWTFDKALFFAVNVGLGIGYGELSVTGTWGILFTILYYMMGSCFIASTGGLLLKSVMEQQDRRMTELNDLREAPAHPPHRTMLIGAFMSSAAALCCSYRVRACVRVCCILLRLIHRASVPHTRAYARI